MHSFRHTFITDMLEALGDAKAVMQLSGHSNYEGFQIYLHASKTALDMAREVLKRRDGNLTGLGESGVAGVTGATQSAIPSTIKRCPKMPVTRVLLTKSGAD